MGKTRDVFKKIRDTKGTFHARMGSIKDRNGMDLTEAEDITKRWQEYTEELYKKKKDLYTHRYTHTYVCAKSLQLCPTLLDPMSCSLPSSSVHGILQARILEWVAMPSSRGSSRPRDQTHVSYPSSTGRQVLYHYTYHLGHICITKSLCHTPETNTTL